MLRHTLILLFAHPLRSTAPTRPRRHAATSVRCSPRTSNSASKPVTGRACINAPAPVSANSRPKSNSCAPDSACANANSLAARRNPPRAHPPDSPTVLPASEPPRPCGQQRGRPSPPRRDYRHLPVVLHDLELPADQQQCPQCGQPFTSFPGTADSELLEIEVRAYRRCYRRRRYRPSLPVRLPARPRHRTGSRQTPSQKSVGRVRLGHGIVGQVCLRPTHATVAR